MFRTLEYSSLEFVSNFVLQNSDSPPHASHAVIFPGVAQSTCGIWSVS